MRKALIILSLLILAVHTRADPASDIAIARRLNQWIHETIEYRVSRAVIQEPRYTLQYGGDCADMAALLVDMLEHYGIPARIVVLDLRGPIDHAVVDVWGVILDPQAGNVMLSTDEYPITHKVAFDITLPNLLADWERLRKKSKQR